jgi:endonuclease/exonuclease/phosphatase family metal-dependent hydrolase
MTQLVDADTKKRPTTTPKMRGLEWMPSIRMAQIDHIFVSSDAEVSNFSVAQDGGSDHRAISVDVASTGQKR